MSVVQIDPQDAQVLTLKQMVSLRELPCRRIAAVLGALREYSATIRLGVTSTATFKMGGVEVTIREHSPQPADPLHFWREGGLSVSLDLSASRWPEVRALLPRLESWPGPEEALDAKAVARLIYAACRAALLAQHAFSLGVLEQHDPDQADAEQGVR